MKSKSSDFKYNIQRRLQSLSAVDAKHARRRILRECGITPNTLRRWGLIGHKDKSDIPAGMLHKVASCLNVTILDLFNELQYEQPQQHRQAA